MLLKTHILNNVNRFPSYTGREGNCLAEGASIALDHIYCGTEMTALRGRAQKSSLSSPHSGRSVPPGPSTGLRCFKTPQLRTELLD